MIGKDHCAVFRVRCVLDNPKITIIRQGKSIKQAQQFCAQAILDML
jgi:dsRNA-specific ribonuclease